jgi:tetratricopeptide (TPR) repeat protein
MKKITSISKSKKIIISTISILILITLSYFITIKIQSYLHNKKLQDSTSFQKQGKDLMDQGKPEDALPLFEKSQSLNPDNKSILQDEAWAQFLLHKNDEALKDINDFIDTNSGDEVNPYVLKGFIETSLKQCNLATAAYYHALMNSPKDDDIKGFFAASMSLKGDKCVDR